MEKLGLRRVSERLGKEVAAIRLSPENGKVRRGNQVEVVVSQAQLQNPAKAGSIEQMNDSNSRQERSCNKNVKKRNSFKALSGVFLLGNSETTPAGP